MDALNRLSWLRTPPEPSCMGGGPEHCLPSRFTFDSANEPHVAHHSTVPDLRRECCLPSGASPALSYPMCARLCTTASAFLGSQRTFHRRPPFAHRTNPTTSRSRSDNGMPTSFRLNGRAHMPRFRSSLSPINAAELLRPPSCFCSPLSRFRVLV